MYQVLTPDEADMAELERQAANAAPMNDPGFIPIDTNVADFKARVIAAGDPHNHRGIVGNIDNLMTANAMYRDIMAQKRVGRPGHYYGRDVVIEGEISHVAFALAPNEFGGDPDWYKDDAKFQQYMRNHPGYSWLK